MAAFVRFIPAGRKVYLAFAALAAATQGEHVVPLGNPRTPLPCDNIPLPAQMPVNDHDGASLPRPGLTRVPSLVCPAFFLTGLGNPTTRGKRARATEISALPAHQTYWAARQISKPKPRQGCRRQGSPKQDVASSLVRIAWRGEQLLTFARAYRGVQRGRGGPSGCRRQRG